MSKSFHPDKINAKEQLVELVKHNPKQVEGEIFTDIDVQGFNRNPSEQQEYPGVQMHKQKPPPTRAKKSTARGKNSNDSENSNPELVDREPRIRNK